MANTDPLAKKRAAPILSHDNHEQWFHLMSLYFRSKKIYYTITTSLDQYARILEATPLSSKDTSSAGTPTTDELTREAKRLVLNLEKEEKWRSDDAEAQYQIEICLGDIDQTRVRYLMSAKEKWDSLQKKYTTVLPTAGRQYLDNLVTYKKPTDIPILQAWQELHELKRKVAQTQPVVADAFGDQQLLQRLFQSLPSDYDIIRSVLESQPVLDVDIAIRKLEDHEAKLKSADTALWARGGNNNRDRPRSRRQSPPSLERRRQKNESELDCKLCGEDHWIYRCPHVNLAAQLLKKHQRFIKKSDETKNKSSKDKPTTRDIRKGKEQSLSRRFRAHNADDQDTATDSVDPSNPELSTEEEQDD